MPFAAFSPGDVPGCTVFAAFLAILSAAFWVLGAVFLPSYRLIRIVVSVPVFRFFDVDVGLFKVNASSTGLINIKALRSIKDMSRRIVQAIDNKYLSEFVGAICAMESATLFLFNLGCSEVTMMWVASQILTCCFVVASLLLLFSSFTILAFWFAIRKQKVRKASIVLVVLATLCCVLGVVQYLLLGDPSSSLGFATESVFISQMPMPAAGVGYGFAVAAGAMMWTAVLPFWIHCAVPVKLCSDYFDEKRELKEEQQFLLDDVEREIEQTLGLFDARRPY